MCRCKSVDLKVRFDVCRWIIFCVVVKLQRSLGQCVDAEALILKAVSMSAVKQFVVQVSSYKGRSVNALFVAVRLDFVVSSLSPFRYWITVRLHKSRVGADTLKLTTELMSKNGRRAVIQCLFLNCQFIALSCRTVTHNVLQICDGRDFYHKCWCGALNFRLAQNCLRSTKPRLLQMCC